MSADGAHIDGWADAQDALREEQWHWEYEQQQQQQEQQEHAEAQSVHGQEPRPLRLPPHPQQEPDEPLRQPPTPSARPEASFAAPRCQQCEAVFESQTGSGSEEEEGAAPHAPTQQ